MEHYLDNSATTQVLRPVAERALELMVEDLRRRFGAGCVTRASILHNDLGIDTALSGRKGSLERQEPGSTES